MPLPDLSALHLEPTGMKGPVDRFGDDPVHVAEYLLARLRDELRQQAVRPADLDLILWAPTDHDDFVVVVSNTTGGDRTTYTEFPDTDYFGDGVEDPFGLRAMVYDDPTNSVANNIARRTFEQFSDGRLVEFRETKTINPHREYLDQDALMAQSPRGADGDVAVRIQKNSELFSLVAYWLFPLEQQPHAENSNRFAVHFSPYHIKKFVMQFALATVSEWNRLNIDLNSDRLDKKTIAVVLGPEKQDQDKVIDLLDFAEWLSYREPGYAVEWDEETGKLWWLDMNTPALSKEIRSGADFYEQLLGHLGGALPDELPDGYTYADLEFKLCYNVRVGFVDLAKANEHTRVLVKQLVKMGAPVAVAL